MNITPTRPLELTVVRERQDAIERRTMKFRTMDELYEWATEHGVAPERAQMSLEI